MSVKGGEGGSRLPTSSASRTDSRFLVSNERFFLMVCVQYPWSITYAGRWFLPSSIPPPPFYQTWPHSILAFPSLLFLFAALFLSLLPSSCLPSFNRTRSDPIRKSPGHPLRRVLLPVAHPKNIPRLIQPPCAPISHVHSGSLLRWQPLVES